MSLAGESLSLLVSLVQEVGVVLGLGAVTITLVGHLLALHAHVPEMLRGYMRAARQARAIALGAILLSGLIAVLIHLQSGTAATLLAPAFIFKWLLIALLTSFYFFEIDARGWWQDAVEGFEGANWYALFIVHSMAPVVGWVLMLEIYAGWLAAFGAVWAGFVWLMRAKSTLAPVVQKAPAVAQPAKPIAAPVAVHTAPVEKPQPPIAKPVQAPAPVTLKPVVPPVQAPKPVLTQPHPVVAPVVPSHVPTQPAHPVAPALKPILEVHANHSMLPMIAELDLPAPPEPAAPPVPLPHIPDTPPMPPDTSLPHITVMPRQPEDIK